MSSSKWQLSNTTRIMDVKNTRQAHNPKPNTRRPKPQEDWQATPAQPPPQSLSDENRQLRSALIEAIDENECLRERVIELQALLVESQCKMESMEEKFMQEMNLLQRMLNGKHRPLDARSRSI